MKGNFYELLEPNSDEEMETSDTEEKPTNFTSRQLNAAKILQE